MKKLLPAIFAFCLFTTASAQVTLTQIPETPLTYLGYELTSPDLKAGYTKRTQYFGTPSASLQIGLIVQQKYSDLPIYSYFSELSDFIGYVESKSTVSRTTNYVAYLLEVKTAATDPYVTYAKDTFFLSGTTITNISETIYDVENSTPNTIDTYAKYDVSYHSNGNIERIKLTESLDNNSVFFGGIYAVYNPNNTLKTDTLYQYGYDGSGDKSTFVSIYQDHTYQAANLLKIDQTLYYQIGSNPELNTKFSYVLNTNNEITRALGYTYNSSNSSYENTFYYDFGQESSLGVLSQSAASAVALYPNPVQDLIYIPSDCSFKSWSISSVTGLQVKSGTNADLNKISVADLEAGMYVLTLQNNEQTWTGKFIK